MGATPDHGDPMADLDQDGIANSIEHALGKNDTDGGEGGSVMEVGVQNFSVNEITNNFLVIFLGEKSPLMMSVSCPR